MGCRGIRVLLVSLGAVALLGTACAYKASYNPRYLDGNLGGGVSIAGEAALFVAAADEAYVFKGRPKSLTAVGSTIEMPLGRMNKEIALAALGRVFRGGIRPVGTDRGAPGVHLIRTRVSSFEYRFNTLRNLTFANTPQVRIVLEIGMQDPGGREVLAKTYDTGGWYSGTTVLDTMKPAELINMTTHAALAEMYARAAADIRDAWTVAPVRPAEHPVPDAAVPAPAAPRDAAERLRQLRSLRDQGLIDDEAYRRKEQEILEGL